MLQTTNNYRIVNIFQLVEFRWKESLKIPFLRYILYGQDFFVKFLSISIVFQIVSAHTKPTKASKRAFNNESDDYKQTNSPSMLFN